MIAHYYHCYVLSCTTPHEMPRRAGSRDADIRKTEVSQRTLPGTPAAWSELQITRTALHARRRMGSDQILDVDQPALEGSSLRLPRPRIRRFASDGYWPWPACGVCPLMSALTL